MWRSRGRRSHGVDRSGAFAMYVLFLDDSCGARAPIAEAVLRHHAPDHDSAAAGWAPSHVRPEVRQVLSESGLPTDRLRARGLSAVGVEDVDVLVSFVPDEGRVRLPAH